MTEEEMAAVSDTVDVEELFQFAESFIEEEISETEIEDLEKARVWYEKAAQRGHALSMHQLGRIAYFSEYECGIDGNFSESVRWFLQSASRGLSGSYMELVRLYKGFNGQLGQYDSEEPFVEIEKWLLKAADENVPLALNLLAELYYAGPDEGLWNRDRALFYTQAVLNHPQPGELCEIESLCRMAHMVAEDDKELARKYLEQAIELSSRDARSYLEQLETGEWKWCPMWEHITW